jgi:disulfide bond formation protein DsbB
MSLVVQLLATATLAGNLFLIGYTIAYVLNRYAGIEVPGYERFNQEIYSRRYYLALVVSALATGGSLYLSNGLGWEPCRLCWFQRIMMYPLVVIIGWGLVLGRDDMDDYVLPLSVLGAGTAIYHYGIQRVEQFSSAGCSILSVSCSTEYTFHFGYINIPMMALTAFLLILAVLYLSKEN